MGGSGPTGPGRLGRLGGLGRLGKGFGVGSCPVAELESAQGLRYTACEILRRILLTVLIALLALLAVPGSGDWRADGHPGLRAQDDGLAVRLLQVPRHAHEGLHPDLRLRRLQRRPHAPQHGATAPVRAGHCPAGRPQRDHIHVVRRPILVVVSIYFFKKKKI